MAVEQFVSKTLELLQEEREAEIEETRYVKSCVIAHVNRIISESDNSFIRYRYSDIIQYYYENVFQRD